MEATHVVALSGGKDSTAMALRLQELGEQDYVYVCTPTGDELPEMVDHWERMEELLDKPIRRLYADTDLNGLIEKFSALPNYRMRWCTRILKIQPFEKFMRSIEPAVSYVGLRADEESRVGAVYGEGIEQRFPMQEWGWGLKEVMAYLDEKGVKVPSRTDCARCYHQRLGEWWMLWRHYPDIYAEAEGQEAMTGRTFRSAHRDTWPADLKGLRQRFENGDLPRGIDRDTYNAPCRVCSL